MARRTPRTASELARLAARHPTPDSGSAGALPGLASRLGPLLIVACRFAEAHPGNKKRAARGRPTGSQNQNGDLQETTLTSRSEHPGQWYLTVRLIHRPPYHPWAAFPGLLWQSMQVGVTGDEMSDCLRRIGWSANELGRRLNVNEHRLRRMLTGRAEIPPNLAEWLRCYAQAIGRLPPLPKDWTRGRSEP
jgi:hypothetical protein